MPARGTEQETSVPGELETARVQREGLFRSSASNSPAFAALMSAPSSTREKIPTPLRTIGPALLLLGIERLGEYAIGGAFD
jgi:hypothetical protein